MDEFVLRTLKLTESIPAKRLAAYFGFSEAEAETVISDLVARGLLSVDGDNLSLHASAHEHFRGVDEGAPRVVEIDTWVDRVWFDLISRNMMVPERARPLRNLIDLPSENISRDVPIAFARRAFEENFAEYLRKVRRVNNPDRIGLYSVSEVQQDRFGFVVVKGWEDLLVDPEPKLRAHLLDIEVDDLTRYLPLTSAMTDAYRRLKGPEPSNAALEDFQRLVGDTSVVEAHHKKGGLDLGSWLSTNAGALNRERRAIFGASYLVRNIDVFTSLVTEKLISKAVSVSSPLQLVWFRPGGTVWGTSSDLQDALFKIRGAVRAANPQAVVHSKLVIPQILRRDNPFRFNRLFDDGYIAPAGYLSPGLEIMYLEGVGAIVLVVTSMAPTVTVSVGFALVDDAGVQRIHKALEWQNLRKSADKLWTKSGDNAEDEIVPEIPRAEPEEDS
ncbi:hypothetical protein [Taklimakanibacter deserti]|uniref:hypothetical protein n=1 Tax=Taklimakanibacter deserti TaxID=2267839 RepID=UPI000E65B737